MSIDALVGEPTIGPDKLPTIDVVDRDESGKKSTLVVISYPTHVPSDKEIREGMKKFLGIEDADFDSGIIQINESEAEGGQFHLRDIYISGTGKVVERPHYVYDDKGVLQYSVPEGKKIRKLKLDDYVHEGLITLASKNQEMRRFLDKFEEANKVLSKGKKRGGVMDTLRRFKLPIVRTPKSI